jgi:hypothetical protein
LDSLFPPFFSKFFLVFFPLCLFTYFLPYQFLPQLFPNVFYLSLPISLWFQISFIVFIYLSLPLI